MLTLAALVVMAPPQYVAGYQPKVGDTVVLARDEAGRRVMTVKDSGSAMGFKDYAVGDNDDHYEAIAENPQVAEVDAGTTARVVEAVAFGNPPALFGVKLLDGPLKGQTRYTFRPFLRKEDPAYAREAAARRKSRPPLDKAAIAAEVKAAVEKANPNDASAGLRDKKALVRKAVEPICERHQADFPEVNALATAAGVTVTLGGKTYDLAGNTLKK